MDNLKPHNSIHDQVLQAIKQGKVTMRPKWHFVLRTAVLILGTILVFLTALYLTSFIVFVLRQTGVLYAPALGPSGLSELLGAMPWLLVAIAVIFIIFLQVLIKKYSFGYGKPLLYSAAVIIVLAIAGGFLIEMTPLHRGLFYLAEQRQLLIAGVLYRDYGEQKFDNLVIGTIKTKNDNGYVIVTREGQEIAVMLTAETKQGITPRFVPGDVIVVFGDRSDDTITAEGIQRFTGQTYAPLPDGD